MGSLKVDMLSIAAEDDGIIGVDSDDLRDCLNRKFELAPKRKLLGARISRQPQYRS